MRQVYKKWTFLYLFLIIKFTNAKLQNILTCLVMDEWRRKMWHVYPVEHYSPIEKNGILCFIANWMKLEAHCIDWNKSDIGDHQHVFPFICGCWRELVWIYSNFRVAMEGERKGKNDWTIGTRMQVNVIGGRGWGVSSVGTVYISMSIWVEIPQHPCKKHSMAAHASAGTVLGAHWGAGLIGSLKLPVVRGEQMPSIVTFSAQLILYFRSQFSTGFLVKDKVLHVLVRLPHSLVRCAVAMVTHGRWRYMCTKLCRQIVHTESLTRFLDHAKFTEQKLFSDALKETNTRMMIFCS